MGGRRTWGLFPALALLAAPLTAAPVDRVATLPDGARVLDVRGEDACAEASLPGARCLPADWLFEADGGPMDFGALRWLLGGLGLNGTEEVAIWPADERHAKAAAALIYLAGQARVVLLDSSVPPIDRGEPRSFSREVVFSTPMRIEALAVAHVQPDGELVDRLGAFARGDTETVAFGPAD